MRTVINFITIMIQMIKKKTYVLISADIESIESRLSSETDEDIIDYLNFKLESIACYIDRVKINKKDIFKIIQGGKNE